MVVFLSLGGIPFLPVGQILVLGVPEDEIRDAEFLCQFTGVHDGAVMFLVGLELFPLAVQAESLVEQPPGAPDIGQQGFAVGFVAGESQVHAVIHMNTAAELLFLRRTDIEEGKTVAKNFFLLPVLNNMEEDAFVEMGREFFPYGQAGEGLDGVHQLTVAVYVQIAFIAALVHGGGGHADDPDHAQNVVVVGVGDEHMMDLFQRDLLLFQGEEDAVAAAGVGQKVFLPFLHGKAGIIAVNGLGVSRAENNQFFHFFVPPG